MGMSYLEGHSPESLAQEAARRGDGAAVGNRGPRDISGRSRRR
jgi:hypothetical protein